MSPYTKNPMLSLWLSGANTLLGASRSVAMAESQRIANTMFTKGTEQMMQFWTDAMSGSLLMKPRSAPRPAPKRTPAKRRRASSR